ncbi:hypothetical protein OJAV_G00113630 [Oryzias javanicus]|uniref:Uncharacterized protein n=1 Tax=Oryzias javanicus TaxID=123683 RepID=A0A3S2P8D7_ORYJA|nr:hypothetical protein OJAV_G00113630 [Oryzias javanicus]
MSFLLCGELEFFFFFFFFPIGVAWKTICILPNGIWPLRLGRINGLLNPESMCGTEQDGEPTEPFDVAKDQASSAGHLTTSFPFGTAVTSSGHFLSLHQEQLRYCVGSSSSQNPSMEEIEPNKQ